MAATIRLRESELDRLCSDEWGIGTDAELSRVLGLDRGSVYRARKSGRVGAEFVARALVRLPATFDDLFEAEVEDDPIALDATGRLVPPARPASDEQAHRLAS